MCAWSQVLDTRWPFPLTVSCACHMRVQETEKPVVSVPADITKISPGPTAVTFAVTAADTFEGVSTPVAVGCTPASGSTFPVGSTWVTCTASDAVGNTAVAKFKVQVKKNARRMAM